MMNLFYSVPKQSRSRINLSALFKKRQLINNQPINNQGNTLIKTDSIKYIDATLLYDNNPA